MGHSRPFPKGVLRYYYRGCVISAWTAPSHYLNQCWNIVNWTLRNKLQWKFNRNSNIFIYENAHENVVCEMASILSWPQFVNTLFSVVKCKRGEPAMHRSCISRLVCIEPPVCYLSPIEHNVILCIHHYCACFSFSGGLHASGQTWP